MSVNDGGNEIPAMDFGLLLNLAGVVFLDDLTDRLRSDGFDGFSSRTGWVIRSIGTEHISLRDLAERLGLSSPGTLKAIDPMVSHGYLERVGAADRRVRAVKVTERGHEALAAARRFHAEFEAQFGESLGADGSALLRTALESLVRRGSRRVPQILVTQPSSQTSNTPDH